MLLAKTLDFFTIDPGTIIFTLLNTLILVLVLKKFLFNRVNSALEERQKAVQDGYDKADEAVKNAKRLEQEYVSKIRISREEAGQIISGAITKAQNRSDEIIAEANEEASRIMIKTNREIEREKKRASSEAKQEITNIAFLLASKVVKKEITSDDNDKIISDFIDSVGEDE